MKRHDKEFKKNIYDTLNRICENSGALIIGLTGGIATGKSTVSRYFEKLGAVVIDFDVLARKVVEPDKESWKLIINYFGDNILNTDNSINRKKLSDIVFGDHFKREKLESFTHPHIWAEFLHHVGNAIARDKNCIIVAVVPLLIEGDMQNIFSKNVAVYAPQETQIQRLMERDKITREKAKDILSSQMPVDEKIHFADFIIKNEGSIDSTKEQIKNLWENLK